MSSIRFDAPQNAHTDDTIAAPEHSSSQRSFKNTLALRLSSLAIAASVASVGLISAPAAQAATVSQTAGTTTATTGAAAAAVQAAQTAAPKKVRAAISIKASKKSWTKGSKAAKVSVKVKAKGKTAKGKVRIYDGTKRLRTIKLKNGKASYRLPKKLSAKKHTIKVIYTPSGSSAKVVKPTSKSIKVRVKSPSKSQRIVREAKKHVGVPYVWGGTSPKRGFDCSGFTSYVYKKAGVAKLPRSSGAQRYAGKRVSRSKARAGDLVWTPGHIAIYMGKGKIIDAPRPGKSIKVRKMHQKNPTFIRV
ncbi:C40 family peptidase [Timonella sp. A28]|uniref:C40 family peptidase n=1 Tax=Timonella sp. A28 TaxID=3442640 RepID=UPI003EBB2E04